MKKTECGATVLIKQIATKSILSRPTVTVTVLKIGSFRILDQGRAHSWKNLSAISVLAFCIRSVNFLGKEERFAANKNSNLHSLKEI
jgi:hypothetical protein